MTLARSEKTEATKPENEREGILREDVSVTANVKPSLSLFPSREHEYVSKCDFVCLEMDIHLSPTNSINSNI